MAKSSDYKTLARGLAGYYVRARLMSDSGLTKYLELALERAITYAKRLEIEEIRAKAGG